MALQPPAARLYFLDWLRIGALGVLILYHVGMVYVRWDFHVKSPFAAAVGPTLEPWMKLSEPWRMSLLFMVSGAATAHMLRSRSGLSLLRQRSRQLLLPLVLGLVLIVPPQPYVEAVQKFGYSGSYASFLGLYFTGFNGFCQAGKCLPLPTWNHLWFLPYLWLYTALLVGLLAVWPAALSTLAQAAPRWLRGAALGGAALRGAAMGVAALRGAALGGAALRGAALMVLPVVVLALLRLALAPRFPSNHAVVGDWFNHAQYGAMFLLGAVAATAPTLWDRMMGLRWPALLLALAAWAVLVGLWVPRPGGWAGHAVVAAVQWCALVAAFGWARRLLDHDHPLRARAGEAVFPVYIFHQTVIVLAVFWLAPQRWPPALEGPVLVLLAFGISLAAYAVCRQVAVLRPWLGMANKQAGGLGHG